MTRDGVVWIVLFLCTEWILFSGVKLLISRCVFFLLFFLLDSGSPALFSAASCSMKLNFSNKLYNENFTK